MGRCWLPPRRADWHGWREVWLADGSGDGGKEEGVSGVETGQAVGFDCPGLLVRLTTLVDMDRHRVRGAGVTERRHFTLWRRREECQWNTHTPANVIPLADSLSR